MPSDLPHFNPETPLSANDSLQISSIKLGKLELRDVVVNSRQAGIQLYEILQLTIQQIENSRRRRNSTRFPDTLPIASPARRLSEEVADYLADMTRRALQDTTTKAAARSLKILQITCGNIPVSMIDHRHIHQMWNLLRSSPPNLTSDPKLQCMTVDALIALGKKLNVPAPAIATLELHRRMLTTFFQALVNTKAIPHSPMAAFRPVKASLLESSKSAERLLSTADVQRIFNPDTFTPWASKFPHRWWATMIGLFTGARVNEVAQLKVADIIQDQGTWCIAIRMTKDADLAKSDGQQTRQRLKGKSAIRTIPVHPALLKAGLLDFVADIRACGHPRLFPQLSAGVNKATGRSNARYSQALVIQLSNYFKDLGFPKGVGFHGFRHTLATELEAAGVSEEDIALITGHSISKKVPVLHTNYIHRSPQLVRERQIAALAKYNPPVVLPAYQRGQFKEKLGKGARMYP